MKMGYYYKTSSNDSDDEEIDNEYSTISPMVRFWILLIPTIFAVICSIIVLWIILSNAEHRRSLHYRVIIIQLVAGLLFLLTHIPLYLIYNFLGYVWPQSSITCEVWWFFGEGYSDTITILMVWASFERHILIFHDRLVSTRKKRIIFHYIPVTSIIIYYFIYYTVVNAVPSCENHYDLDENSCGLSCLYENRVLIMYDTIVNDISATILIAIFSVSLILRITCQNRMHLRIRNRLKKHRKLIVILLAVSFIYLIFNLPLMILVLAHLCGLPEETVEQIEPYFEFLNYYIFIIYPFICLGTILQKFLNQFRRRLIGPINPSVLHQSTAQQVAPKNPTQFQTSRATKLPIVN